MQLETDRLNIVPLELSLLRLLLAGMPRLEQALGLTPSGSEPDAHTHQAMAYLAELAQRTPGAYPWITNWQIILKHRNCSAGSACFMDIPRDGEVEIGYGIDPPFRNRGMMGEALRAITDWALAQPGVIRVAAETELDNTVSQRLLAHCGFRPVSATRWLLCGHARELCVPLSCISTHSSEETQAFYRSAGCPEAAEFMPDLFELKPCDCHLELGTAPPVVNMQPGGET